MRRHPAVFAILVGGSIAAVLDITYAIVYSGFYGVSAVRILQSVASGIFGLAAYDGGPPMAALGLFLHFFIMYSIAAIYFGVSRWLGLITRRPVGSGLFYGAVVYAVMNLIVLPLSAFPHDPNFAADRLAINFLVHMFFIGLPISLATYRVSVRR
jgi:hypothetical protein